MLKRSLLLLLAILVIILGVLFWRHDHASTAATTKPVTSSKTGVTTKKSATTTKTFDKTQYSTTNPTSPWVVVNKQHPLSPVDYAPTDLTSVGNGQVMRAEAATALTNMFTGAKAVGLTITTASAYRSYTTQVSVYNAEVKDYGHATADSESARPGFSEHQTGWAVDIAGGGCSITDCFGTTAEGKWAAANSYKYGFILRYEPSDVDITGYRSEPWHFRYVGIPLATEMHNDTIPTLEQFFNITGGTTY